jgi:tRNA modification GTPase
VDARIKSAQDDLKLFLTKLNMRSSQTQRSPGSPAHTGATLPARQFAVSALTGEGIGTLLTALGERVAQSYRTEAPVLTRARHRQSLEEARASLQRALAATLPELQAEDLRLALRSLGQITGVVDVEDLLDVIFRDFCIGK